ncbi:helix-turn-helix domain-containing protein [Cellulosimicrobium cellulans]
MIAELLNVSESWLRRYGDEHGLPVHRVGSQRRYLVSQVTAWVEAGGGR